jgi:hypothetical protein
MEKMTYNSLAVAIAITTGIMLATSGAASVLAQQYTAPPAAPKAGNPSSNSPMKSGNTTSAGGMMNKTAAGNATKTAAGNATKTAAGNATKTAAGNATKAGNTTTLSGQGTPGAPFKPTANMTAGNATKAGNTTAANMTKAAGNATSTTITKLRQAVGGGLNGLGNMISGGKK